MSEQNNADPLTGLPGYDAVLPALEQAIASAKKRKGAVSLGLFDIDWFGKLNDMNGVAACDALLRRLAAHLRGIGTGQGRRLFRYGGDAFLVLFEMTEKEQAFLLMEGAREAFPAGGGESDSHAGLVACTVSAGAASYPDDGRSPGEVLRKVNEALYRAKARGRNQVCMAREERMVTKTSHYTQGQLEGLSRLAKREGVGEAVLLREALDDLLRKYNS